MTILNSDIVKNLYYTNILYEIHTIEDKLSFFKVKYKMSYEDFEQKIKSSVENFDNWDDYMEWKAFTKKHKELSSQKIDIEN